MPYNLEIDYFMIKLYARKSSNNLFQTKRTDIKYTKLC